MARRSNNTGLVVTGAIGLGLVGLGLATRGAGGGGNASVPGGAISSITVSQGISLAQVIKSGGQQANYTYQIINNTVDALGNPIPWDFELFERVFDLNTFLIVSELYQAGGVAPGANPRGNSWFLPPFP